MAKLQFLSALLLVFALDSTRAQYVATPLVKACFAEINAAEADIKIAMEQASFPEDNETFQKLGVCVLRGMLTDDHKLVENETTMKEFIDGVELNLGGKRKLAELISRDLIKVCSNVEAPSKEIAAVRISNCIRKRFNELMN